MFNSKFNLYNSEWLELVFSDRNKSYGAYDLRQHYSENVLKALFITVTLFTALLIVPSLIFKNQVDPVTVSNHEREDVIHLTDLKPPPAETAPVKTPAKTQPTTSAVTQKSAPSQVMKVVSDPLATTEPKPVTGQSTSTGLEDTPGDIPALDAPAGGGGNAKTGNAEGSGDGLVPFTGLEKLPEFPGGMEGWSKFLSKNLRYPEQASSEGVSGRVYMSFTIEKDGRITDIQVTKPAGHGFDEEAKRVLKMAPAWKPGIQNGKAVRVRYTIPINFTIQE